MQEEQNQKLIKIWYAGLNKAYFEMLPIKARRHCHDNPWSRVIVYTAIAINVTLLCALPLMMIYYGIMDPTSTMVKNTWWPWITGLLVLGSLFGLYHSTYHRAIIGLIRAIRAKEDTDYADPFRFEMMREALSWGLKKGIVVTSDEGEYKMKEKQLENPVE